MLSLCNLFFFRIKKNEGQLIYKVVLIFVQQSASAVHIYIYIHTHSFFIFFSIMVYHRILNIVPCAIQQDLVGYPTNKALYNSLHLLTPASQSFLCNPFLATTSLFSMSVSLFLFHREVHLYYILDSTYR